MHPCVAVTRAKGTTMSQSQQSFVAIHSQAVRVSKPVALDSALLHLVVGGASKGPTGGWTITAVDKGPTGGW